MKNTLTILILIIAGGVLEAKANCFDLEKNNPFSIDEFDSTRLWNPRFTVDLKIGSVMSFVPKSSNIPFENLNTRGTGLTLIGVDAGLVLFEDDKFDFGLVGGAFLFSAVSSVLKTGPDSTIYTSQNYQHLGVAANFKLINFNSDIRTSSMFKTLKLGFFYGLGNFRMSVPGINRAGSITGNEISFSLVLGK